MKCIHCANDAKKSERTDGTCPKCGKRFAFEPQSGDPFTDMAFKTAIDRVSGKGTVKFLESNLFYEVVRTIRKRDNTPLRIVMAVASAVLSFLFMTLGVYGAGLALGGVAIFLVVRLALPKSDFPHEKFRTALGKWRNAHGDPPGLIRRSAKAPTPATSEVQEELEAYSFDRAVITDRAETAELLLANDFHFENNCAVLSYDGAPAHAFETVRRMLRKNPRIEVFALHDCTTRGCRLAWNLKNEPAWFSVGTIYDVALRPRQAEAPSLKRFARKTKNVAIAAGSGITAAEANWLYGWSLELAAIRPEQLIKRLYRAMQKLPELAEANSTGGDIGGDGVILWSTDADASDGGADSFG